MVDNTIALRVQTPQLESPLNRMARGMQLAALKSQVDTAQQEQATRNSLRDIMSAPGFDITNPKNAQTVMAADPKLGTQMVSGMTAVQDLATKKADAGRKTLATGMLSLLHDSSDGNIDNVATLLRAQGVPEDALNTTVASLKALPPEQRISSIKQHIATDENALKAMEFTAAKWVERKDGARSWYEDVNDNSPSFTRRVSDVELRADPNALLAASTAAANRAVQLQVAQMKANAPLPPVKIGKPGEEVLVFSGHTPDQPPIIVEPRYATPPAEGVPGEAGQTMPQRAEAKGRQGFDQTLRNVAEMYRQLDEMGGMVNGDNSMAANLGVRMAATDLGKTIGGIRGGAAGDAATLRENITGAAQDMLAALKKANNGTSREYDTNQDVERALRTFSDPTKTMGNVRDTFNRLSEKYGLGQKLFPAKGDAATGSPTGGAPNAPKIGEVVDGYTFKGGDPSKQENWSK